MQSIDRERQRQGPRAAEEPVGIPGFRAGFRITFDADRRTGTVGPGIMTIGGTLVRLPAPSHVHRGVFREPAAPSAFHYIYMGIDGVLHISRSRPVFDAQQFSDVHPEDQHLHAVGRYYNGADGMPLAAETTQVIAGETWVISSMASGNGSYKCDGVADEVEIGMALQYQREVAEGGVVRLSAGRFLCGEGIQGSLESVIEGQGPRTILVAPSFHGFQNLSAQLRNLRHINADDDRVFALWGGGIATSQAFAANAPERDVYVTGDLYVSGRVVAGTS